MPRANLTDEQRCTATSKTSGERCRLERMAGQRVCWRHGGKSPRALAAARRRLAVEEVLFAAMARRGQIPAVPERFTEAAGLAEAVGLVAGDGPEAHVARVVDSSDATVIRAERAFRSWWEAREQRPVESVSEAEAEDLQRAVLAAIPGGRA